MRSALAVAAIAALAVAGCGDDEETTTTPTTTSTTSSTTPGTTGPTGEQDAAEPAEESDGSSGVAVDVPGKDPNAAIEAFFISGDPDVVCGQLATEELLQTAYGDEEGCRQAQVPGATADAVVVKKIVTKDAHVDAIVIPEGGPNDGFEHEVQLVDEGGAWKVDSIEADIPAGP